MPYAFNSPEFIDSLTPDSIEQLIEEKTEETIHLEFKQLPKNDPKFEHRSAQKDMSIAISGFSYAEGGTIIWGIKTAKSANDVDSASGTALIPDCNTICKYLKGKTPIMVDPPLDGVIHKPIPIQDNGAGVIATYVPRSAASIHMAKWGGESRYHFRASDRFLRMEHYQIADGMNRKLSPKLKLQFEPKFNGYSSFGSNITVRYQCPIYLANSGPVVAKYPLVELQFLNGWIVVKENPRTQKYGLPLMGDRELQKHEYKMIFSGGLDDVIHPNQRIWIGNAQSEVPLGYTPNEFRINFSIAAEHCALKSGEFFVPSDQLILGAKEFYEQKKPQ